MGSELSLNESQTKFTSEQLDVLRSMGVDGASDGELALFFNYAQKTGLDPFSNQIYMIGRKSKVNNEFVTKYTIQVGIDGLRTIAHRTADRRHMTISEGEQLWCDAKGEWHDVWIMNIPPVAAKYTIYCNDSKFTGIALYNEYAGTRMDYKTGKKVLTQMWETKSAHMLMKCAEALALRKAFPMETAGLYTTEEMDHVNEQPQQANPKLNVMNKRHLTHDNDEVHVDDVTVSEESNESSHTVHEIIDGFKRMNVTDKKQILVMVRKMVNRDVENANDLTQAEIDKVVNDLNNAVNQ